MTEEMGQAIRGLPTAICLCINVICDKLKADYFLEEEAKRLAPGLSLAGSDGSVRGVHYGPVPSDCTATDAAGLSASHQMLSSLTIHNLFE